MKIKDLSASERPRERLLAKGVAALSDSELLAIIIKNGARGVSAIEMAQMIMADCDGHLSNLSSTSLDKLCATKGMGKGKACSIVAALELGRRFMSESSSLIKKPLTTAKDAYDQVFPIFKGLEHEECWILFLNNHNYLISKMKLCTGDGESTTVNIKKAVRSALEKSASGAILVHNHPSGSPSPSRADIQQTDSLHQAMNSVGVSLLDHLIICDDCFYAFSDEKIHSAL